MVVIDDELLRREGMADAAVHLVAKRIVPTMALLDWGRALDLSEIDLQHAVERFKRRAKGLSATAPRAKDAPRRERQAILDALRVHGPVESEDGRANSKLRALCPIDIDVFVMTSRLRELEDQGLVVRRVEGKRTFSIGLAR